MVESSVSFGLDPELENNVDKGVAIYSNSYCLVNAVDVNYVLNCDDDGPTNIVNAISFEWTVPTTIPDNEV
jgi:hypothetical protein